jgi:hypothetical protein
MAIEQRIEQRGRKGTPWLRAAGSAALVSTLAACGGGIQESGNGSADRLTCATTCKSSSSLASNQIRPAFVVVSDGARVQAQAGFSSGSDLRFNVEIDGTDSLRLNTAQGTQNFRIPATSFPTIIVDALRTLIAGATPYLSEVNTAAGASPLNFEFVRNTTVLASTVELPAPFQIASPADGATLALTARILPVRLSGAATATVNGVTLNCTDVNGNTATGTSQLSPQAGSVVRDASGIGYTLDIGSAIDRLTFSSTFPRGAVARCDVALKLIMEAQGQADARFASPQIYAQQIRSASVALR